ncbi:hypothetical protein BCR33DRAFT_721811 [Rhizoclosmatium globosum]|uniref:Uncharacterized protein n=1 Tax=Rhizoclosmatium globosum TaxID=329046 RepID=A0A1Y2BQ67_9FUNG|nr:hypothetical protein BCR33DRAFT_721811 [Rhizoclosmatium globosum]|eukprot:ORY36892.1 hypothetical protein BCR33DRAFT_721811 [Rhizoclosmatium globosum]
MPPLIRRQTQQEPVPVEPPVNSIATPVTIGLVCATLLLFILVISLYLRSNRTVETNSQESLKAKTSISFSLSSHLSPLFTDTVDAVDSWHPGGYVGGKWTYFDAEEVYLSDASELGEQRPEEAPRITNPNPRLSEEMSLSTSNCCDSCSGVHGVGLGIQRSDISSSN